MSDKADEIAREVVGYSDVALDPSRENEEELARLIARALRSYAIAYADEKLEEAVLAAHNTRKRVGSVISQPAQVYREACDDVADAIRSLKSAGPASVTSPAADTPKPARRT